MSRLASFQGPSTPSKGPVVSPASPISPEGSTSTKKSRSSKAKQQAGRSRNQVDTNGADALEDGAQSIEGKIHEDLRNTLYEIRNTVREWDKLVLEEGLRAAKEMIDARTSIQNSLAILPTGQLPRRAIVSPQMALINEKTALLEAMFKKLHTLLDLLAHLVDSIESLHIAALNSYHSLKYLQDPAAVDPMNPDTPLYPTTTWSLARFSVVIPAAIGPFYHGQLHSLQKICRELQRSDIDWERARSLLALWKEGGHSLVHASSPGGVMVNIDSLIMEAGWSDELEEICATEIRGWK